MIVFAALAMAALFLCFPDIATQAARSALNVWGRDIVPSLFPYMVLCKMLASRLNRSAMPVVPLMAMLGLMGGSPSGAAMVSVSSDRMSSRQCAAFSALTGTISPMFFLGTLHTWGINEEMCVRLLIAHVCGAGFACACAWRFVPAKKEAVICANAEKSRIIDPITDSVQAVLGVGGCIVFFSVAASCVGFLFPFLSDGNCAFLHAVLEIAGGMRAFSLLGAMNMQRAVCMAALTGFSGLSILTQNHLFLRDCEMTKRKLLVFALLRAVGSGAAMALLFSFM